MLGALRENPSGFPLLCGDGPQHYLTYLPNVVACQFIFYVRPHPGETQGSRGVVPRVSSVLTIVVDTIAVLVMSVLEEAAVGPNSRPTKEKEVAQCNS